MKCARRGIIREPQPYPRIPGGGVCEAEAIPLKRITSKPAGATIAHWKKRRCWSGALATFSGIGTIDRSLFRGLYQSDHRFGPDSPEEIVVELQPVVRDRLMMDEVEEATITAF